jgi:hypothetical protein
VDDGQPGQWLTLAEASQRLGASVDALRKRVRRGQLETRRGNDGLVRVLVVGQPPSGQALADGQPETGHGLADGRTGVDRLEVELASVREELAEARERAAKAEGAFEAMSGRVQDAASQLAKAEARADRLEAALAEARRPWLAKVLDGLRRR